MLKCDICEEKIYDVYYYLEDEDIVYCKDCYKEYMNEFKEDKYLKLSEQERFTKKEI